MDPLSISMPARWRSRNALTGRHYEVRITRGLWGDWHVPRIRGAIGTAMGSERCDVAASRDEALLVIEQIARRRLQRGYRLLST